MTATALIPEQQRYDLLDLLGNLNAMFWGPDRAQCRAMRLPDFFRSARHLADVLGTEAREALAKMEAQVQGYPDAGSLFNSLEEDFVLLFVNARGGIAAPLYQSCYGETTDSPNANALMGAPAVMMQQRLAAADLILDHSSNEPPDHLAIEIEYLYFLLQKGWEEKESAGLREARTFVKSELLGWAPRFEKRLRKAHPDSFYALAAAVLVAVLQFIAEP